jgi:hypothetical protein
VNAHPRDRLPETDQAKISQNKSESKRKLWFSSICFFISSMETNAAGNLLGLAQYRVVRVTEKGGSRAAALRIG